MIIVSRIVLAGLLALIGYQIGSITQVQEAVPDYGVAGLRVAVFVVIGALTGLIAGGLVGKLVQRGLDRLSTALRTRSGAELLVGSLGLLVGLGVAFLASFPLSNLDPVGAYLVLPVTLIIAYVFAEIAAAKHAELLRLVGIKVQRDKELRGKLLDSSVLIDGRIADIVDSGFIEGELIVPVFVLEELQAVADSSDDLRRAKGRRGLDVVHRLRRTHVVRTPEIDWADIDAVDSKLVRLARAEEYSLVTNDSGLERVAKVQQVPVLNVNELANALKPEFVVGESFDLRLVREGKEAGQGVGYLDDGTMVIVDGGREHIGNSVGVEVTSLMQGPQGKLVFGRMAGGKGGRQR